MSLGLKNVQRFGALLAGLSGLLLFVSAPYLGHGPDPVQAKEPVITYQYPEEGDVLKEPPFVLQMCFKEPVNVNDKDKGGDFAFKIDAPPPGPGGSLGVRIVFQPDGYGVALYPGPPGDGEDIEDGEWAWEYRLTDKVNTSDATEGVVKFSVSAADGRDIIAATPPTCLAEGATHIPTAPPAGSPGTTNPPASATGTGPTGSVTPTPDGGEVIDEGGDSDVDILRLALLTIGAAGAAGLIALIGYAIRKRIGYEPHAPHEGDEPPEHH